MDARDRLADQKALLNGYITRIFQLAQMHGQIALASLQQVFELIEFCDFAFLSKIGHDTEAEPAVYYIVYLSDIESGQRDGLPIPESARAAG